VRRHKIPAHRRRTKVTRTELVAQLAKLEIYPEVEAAEELIEYVLGRVLERGAGDLSTAPAPLPIPSIDAFDGESRSDASSSSRS
jgi:hypothetical protein